MQNMVRYLSFDSKSMKTLLSETNKDFFDFNYPLFYKADYEGQSPIDMALEDN